VNELRSPHQYANAKLTVHLHITGTRPDGYHLLDSEMVSLDLVDELRFGPGDGLTVHGADRRVVPPTDDNLVRRALKLAGAKADVVLRKNIPTGGGLGGGSSDAAAALRYAGCTDLDKAVRLGADVPFCVAGGRARVQGIGEVLTPLPFEERYYTLVVPPFGVNTASVYLRYDELRADHGNSASVRNHLEAAALIVEPRLEEWRNLLREQTGLEPTLAGSGSTWFVEGTFAAPSVESLGPGRWLNTRTVPAVDLSS